MRPLLTALAALAITAASCTTAARADEILNLGDPAPRLIVSKWLKGPEVEAFEPGKTYVVSFWATWAPGPDVIAHLTELAHKYKDRGTRFIGIDAFEDEPKLVKPYVDRMGDRMGYSVAMDRVPEGKPSEGAMVKAWMDAADETAIPAAFVVHDGKIAWIGHPMEIDEPLARIVAGKWDVAAAARTRLAEKTRERKARAFRSKIELPYRGKDYRGALAGIEEAIAQEPSLSDEYAKMQFDCLWRLGDTDQAVKVGEKLLKQYHDQAMELNNAFFGVVDLTMEKAPEPRLARLALEALRRANELTGGKNLFILDTLAVAQYRTGDLAGAIATQEEAIRQLDAQVSNKAHPFHRTYRQRLEMYREEAERKSRRAS